MKPRLTIYEAVEKGLVKDVYLPELWKAFGHRYDGIIMNVGGIEGRPDILLMHDDAMYTLPAESVVKPCDFIKVHTRK